LAQISEIASGLNPARLGDAPTTADGAPIVGPDGFVESGNGRTLAIRRAYNQHPTQAAAYKAAVLAQAQSLGVNPAEIARMAKPVLVRERVGGPEAGDLAGRGQLAAKMGSSTVAGMSEPEIAAGDGKLLRESPALDRFVQGADVLSVANNDFRRAFLDLLPQNARASLMQSDGTLSAAGVRRVRNALLASAYDDSATLSRMTEATDDNIKSVGQAMEGAAPQFAKLRKMAGAGQRDAAMDITPDVTAAANALANVRQSGSSVPEYLSQLGLFGDKLSPVGSDLLELFDTYKRRPKIITDTLAQYARGWDLMGSPDQAVLFGGDKPDAHALLRAARLHAENLNGQTAGQSKQPTGQAGTLDFTGEATAAAKPGTGGGSTAPAANRETAPAPATDARASAADKPPAGRSGSGGTSPANSNAEVTAPKPEEMTLRQYEAAHKEYVKRSTGYYDGPEGNADYAYAFPPKAIEAQYIQGIEDAMYSGKQVSARALDAFFEISKNRTDSNSYALNYLDKYRKSAPEGYLPPDARKAQMEEAEARKASRRGARERANTPASPRGTISLTSDEAVILSMTVGKKLAAKIDAPFIADDSLRAAPFRFTAAEMEEIRRAASRANLDSGDAAVKSLRKKVLPKTADTPATGTTLHGSFFGLGQFVEQDVLPALQKFVEAAKEIRQVLDPVAGNPEAAEAARIVRANGGEKARKNVQAGELLKGARKA
ncbi:MAG: hypothetical protein M3Y28_11295, partial [Armatimonadota bacterium]|nr:hypothetical protein [Armatimonadota bacterium]